MFTSTMWNNQREWRGWETAARLNLLSLRRWCHSSTPIFPVSKFGYSFISYWHLNMYKHLLRGTADRFSVGWGLTTTNTMSIAKQRDCLRLKKSSWKIVKKLKRQSTVEVEMTKFQATVCGRCGSPPHHRDLWSFPGGFAQLSLL